MKFRIHAFLVHLAISMLLAGLAFVAIFRFWYPAPLHVAVGVKDIFLLLLGIDVLVGPVLTFFVYRKDKKNLRFDLGSIALVQFLAFAYGVWTVSEGRPAWLVFSVDRFDLVQAYQLDQRKRDEANPEYRSAPWFGPRWVSAHSPASADKRQTILFEAMLAGVDVPHRPELYQPLEAAAKGMREHAHPLDELARYNTQADVNSVLARWPEANAYLPLMARVRPMTVLIDKASPRVVAIVDLNPWE